MPQEQPASDLPRGVVGQEIVYGEGHSSRDLVLL